MGAGRDSLYPFVRFSREEWGRLPADRAFSLSDEEVRGIEPRLSPEEARLIAALFGPRIGVDPQDMPGWSSLLLGPLVRGTEVTVK